MTPAYQHQRVQHALEAVPYVPAHGLRSTHAQTIFAPFFRRRPDVPFARETWETPDDDFLRVVVREGDPKRPVAILIHGLEGSVDAPYVPGIAHLLDAKSYTVVAYDQRGCGGELNRAKRLYHCGVTEDIEFVVRSVQKRWPGRAIMLAGVSLGGNQLGKWLGTHRIPDAVKAATIISPPFNLVTSGAHMDRNMWLYVRHFLRTLIPKALEKERQYPGSIDRDAVRSSRSFADFDTHATAALHGFRDSAHYYSSVGCGQFLADIKTPTLLIAAQDDPFNPSSTIPYQTVRQSDSLHGLFPRHGGHSGFIYGTMHQPRYWAEEQTVRFFEIQRELQA